MIVFTSRGFDVEQYDRDLDCVIRRPLGPREFFAFHNAAVRTEGTPTVFDLFRAVLQFDYPTVQAISAIAHCPFFDFANEVVRPCEKPTDLHFIEVSWAAEVNEYVPEDTRSLEIYVHVSGVGESYGVEMGLSAEEAAENKEPGRYSLSFIPANALAQLPIRINNEFDLSHSRYGGNAAPIEFWKTLVKKVTHDIGLLDFVRAILWEISFHGGPAERDTKADELSAVLKKHFTSPRSREDDP